MSELLEERFAALAPDVGDGDWEAVVRRARRLRPRRRTRILIASLAALALVVTPALAVRQIVRFFSSEPAPPRIVRDFAQLDVAAPRGFAPGVIAGAARKVDVVVTDGSPVVLYVTPTRSGGFCFEFAARGGAGCRPRRPPRIDVSIVRPVVVTDRPFFLAGNVTGDVDELRVEYANGDSNDVPLTYVTKPIDASFFLEPIAARRRVVSLAAYAHGDFVEREVLPKPELLPLIDPRTGAPAGAIASRRRKLIAITTEDGRRQALWVAPRRGGGRCAWLTVDDRPGRMTGCSPRGNGPQPNAVDAGLAGGAPVLFDGPVGRNVASVELRFADGDLVRLTPVEGFVLAEIPSRHWRPGHRLVDVVGRDRAGRTTVRHRFDARGVYPCARPVELGASLRSCP